MALALAVAGAVAVRASQKAPAPRLPVTVAAPLPAVDPPLPPPAPAPPPAAPPALPVLAEKEAATAARAHPTGPVKVTPRAPKTGTLRLDAKPWVRVRSGNRILGQTPLTVELPAGRQQLLLENEALHINRPLWVTISAGGTTSLFERLDAPAK